MIIILYLILLILIIVGIFIISAITGAPYVPTNRNALEKNLNQLIKISSADTVIDFGAGDGVVLDIMSKKGAHTIGIEINPILAFITKIRYCKNSKIKIICRNFYHYSLPKETTVIYAFMLGMHIPLIYNKIKKEATRIGHPIYFISNAFDLVGVEPVKHIDRFYLYKIEPIK